MTIARREFFHDETRGLLIDGLKKQLAKLPGQPIDLRISLT